MAYMNLSWRAPASGETEDPALAARLRRIQSNTVMAAAIWIVASVACTLWLSNRVLSDHVSEAAESAGRDAKAIASVVDRFFHELAAIPHVIARSRDLRAIVVRYNARGQVFTDLPQEERRAQLRKDPDVLRVNSQLTLIRDKLNYDLLYVLDGSGIRVLTSDWDRPITLLGVRLDDREYFQEAMTKGSGHMFAVGRNTRTPVLFFSAPVEDGGRPIGVAVVRQDTDVLGSLLAGGRHATLIVDPAGMVIAASRREFAQRHVGALADRQPDAETLRNIYGQDQLRTIAIASPRNRLHDAEWILEGQPYLVTRASLTATEYKLLVLSPIERVEAEKPLHYVIGALAALFGLLVILLIDRRTSHQARRSHDARLTRELNEKLKAANADKDRYLGIAAHDLRNPLSSIRGLSELMLETPLEPEQQREFLGTIRRTSNELLSLVNDLLDVAVIESGKLDLRLKDQDVARLVDRRVRLLEPQARGKQIKLVMDAPGPQTASIDAARFSQVIDNLVSNAIKFSPSGTTMEVTLRPGKDSFVLSVQDQGPGIPEEERKLLFRSFQKLSARPTGGEKSTGLGLSIVKRIVDAHGGRIDVESGSNGGTRFTVTVPLASAQGAGA